MNALTITRYMGCVKNVSIALIIGIGATGCVTSGDEIYDEPIQGIELEEYLEHLEQNPLFSVLPGIRPGRAI